MPEPEASGAVRSRASRVGLVLVAHLLRVLLVRIVPGDPEPTWLGATVAFGAAVWFLPPLAAGTGSSPWSTRAVLRLLAGLDVAVALVLVGE